MPGFANEDELRRYVGGIFEKGMADPELGPKLADTGLVLRMQCSEPDSALTIDFAGGEVHQGAAGPEPSATMSMTTDMANQYWQGKVNLPMAMARKKISVDGSVSKLLALAPLSKQLFPAYIAHLEEDGRDDLVVS